MTSRLSLLLLLFCSFAILSFCQITDESFDLGDDLVEGVSQSAQEDTPNHLPLNPNPPPNSNTKEKLSQDFDDEDFEGFNEISTKPETVLESKDTTASTPPPPTPEPMNFLVEVVYGTVLVIYLLNYWQGKNQNQNIANSWASEFNNLFKENFYAVFPIIKESNFSYIFTATGRENCAGFQAQLKLKKRHDLFSLCTSLIFPTPDTLIIDVPLDTMEKFTFAIIKKKEEKEKKELSDLKYTHKYETPLLPSNFCVFTDCDELIYTILRKEVEQTLKKHSSLLHTIHITDKNPYYEKYTKVVRFVFLLPPAEKMSELRDLMDLFIRFIDFIPDIQISKTAKAKLDKERLKITNKELKEASALKQQQQLEAKKDDPKKEKNPEVLRKRQERKLMKKIKVKQ